MKAVRLFLTPRINLLDCVTWFPIAIAFAENGNWWAWAAVVVVGAFVSGALERKFNAQ